MECWIFDFPPSVNESILAKYGQVFRGILEANFWRDEEFSMWVVHWPKFASQIGQRNCARDRVRAYAYLKITNCIKRIKPIVKDIYLQKLQDQ